MSVARRLAGRASRRPLRLAALALLAAGLLLHGGRACLALKGALAATLIERAWSRHVETGEIVRPWPWADHHPVGRLEVPRLGVSRLVLSGASGASLAFGPGHVDGTAPLAGPGNRVVAGHRDTWLRFAGELMEGDAIRLATRSGTARFVVRERRVVHETDLGALEPAAGDRLTLVTCWPIEGLLPSTERLVVVASPIDGGAAR